jgi:hypothetical protein
MRTRQALGAGVAAGIAAALTITSLVVIACLSAEPLNQLLWQLSIPSTTTDARRQN